MILTMLGVNGPFPAEGGACSGYLLTSDSGRTHVLFDCGGGVLGRLNAECGIRDLDAVVLTHLHYDHMSDMLPMQYMLDFMGIESLKVFCPETPARVFNMLKGGRLDLYPMNDVEIGEMKIEFMSAAHPVEAYCVRVKCDGQLFVYTGDTNHADVLPIFADGADLLLADAGLLREDWTPGKPHMTPGMCARLAKSARAKQLVLTHLSPLYDPEAVLDEALEDYPNAVLARPGIRISV